MSNYETDPATGLPALPEGFRWFVRERAREYCYAEDARAKFDVEIQEFIPAVYRERVVVGFWRDRTVKYKSFEERWHTVTVLPIYDEEILYPVLIKNTAGQMMRRFNEMMAARKLKDASRHLLGAYPPNTLNNKG